MSRQAYKQTAYGLGSNLELLLISEDRKIVDNMFDNLWKEIAELNGINNPRALKVGMTLKIPVE